MKLTGAGAAGLAGVGAYRRAGVDIDAGARAVELMRDSVRSTFGPRVLADVGHFGGLYRLEGSPDVLVASADGGTCPPNTVPQPRSWLRPRSGAGLFCSTREVP